MKKLNFTSRRFLALVMAVIMVLTVIPMGAFAVADESTPVYTVSANKPAIPVSKGTKVDLSKLYFEFDNGTVKLGSDIEWSTEENGIVLDDSNKTVSLFGDKIYALTASADGVQDKTFYILEPNLKGEKEIYSHTFTQDEVDATNKDLVESSDWDLVTGAGSLYWHSLGGVYTEYNSTTSEYALKPTSKGGKIVSSFRDMTIEANIAFPISFGGTDYTRMFSIAGRANWADNNAISGKPATFAGGGFNGASAATIDWANLNISDSITTYKYETKNTTTETFYNYVVKLIGNDVEVYKNGAKAPISLNETQVEKIASTKPGSLFITQYNTRLIFKDIKVTISFTEDEINNLSSFTHTVDYIPSNKPAIPLANGKKFDLKDLYIQFNDDLVVKGSDITWSTTDTTSGLTVFDSSKAITISGNGIYELVAEYNDESKIIYVFTPDADNTRAIFDYTFSSSDKGLAVTDSKGIPVWSYSGGGSWGWVTTSGASYTTTEGRLRNDGGAGVIYLNPNSEQGKIVSSFADYTFYLRAVTHENWTNPASYSKSFPMLTRYNMAGESYSLANDTYLGYYAYFTTKGGSVYVGGKSVATSTLTYPYTHSFPHVDYKLQVEGAEVIFSAKPGNIDEYTQVFKMSDAAETPAAVLATVGKTGTIGLYTNTQDRPSLQKAKVTIGFDAEELSVFEKYTSDLELVSASKPAIPLAHGKMVDLKSLYFQFDNGVIAQGSDIDWSTTDKTAGLSVSNANKTAILLGYGVYELVAEYKDETQYIYVFTPNDDNTKTIFDYTFSASDAGLKVTDSNGTPIWSYSGGGSWSWVTNTYQTMKEPRLRNDGGAGIIYLNPNSEAGRIVSSFADYTFYLRAVTHENWTNPASYTRYFPMLTRYNMAGESYSLANDTYLGYRAYFTTNGGGVFVGNSLVASSSLTYPYTNDYPHVDFKMQVEGSEVIFAAKPGNTDSYTEVFKMSDSATIPAAVLSTVGKTGTIGVYTDTNNRPSLQKAKVVIGFTDEEIAIFEKYSSDVELVPANKPAIALEKGKILNLSKIYFQFDNGAVALGSEITWSTLDTTGEVIVSDTDKTITLIGTEYYLITAEFGDEEKTFYVMYPDSENKKQIYYHEFKDTELDTTNSKLVDSSDWTMLQGAGSLAWYSKGGIYSDSRSTTATYALKPTSVPGKLVSNFRDVVIETTIAYPITFGGVDYQRLFTLAGRVNWADNTAMSGASTYAGGGFNGASGATIDYANLNVSGIGTSYNYTTKNTSQDVFYKYKVTLIGNDIEIYKDGAKAPIALNDSQKEAIGKTKAGSILLTQYNTRLVFKDITVSVPFTDEEIAIFDKYSKELDMIATNETYIPMKSGKTISLKDIYVAFEDGSLTLGKNVNWSAVETNSSILVDNTAKTVTLLGSKIYPLKASFGSNERIIYVFEPEVNNTKLLYEHTFSASDISGGAFVADSDWFDASGTNALTVNSTTGGITAGMSTAYYTLKADSKPAKIISAFPNVIMEARLGFTTQYGPAGANFIMGVRANWTNNNVTGIPSSYVGAGYRTCLGGTSSGSDYAVTYVNSATQTTNLEGLYNKANDLRTYTISVIGDDLKVYREGTELAYTMTDAQKEAMANTKGGSIWFRGKNEDRLIVKDVIVSAVISPEEIAAYEKLYVEGDSVVVSAAKPAIPMEVDKKAMLSSVYFEFDNGDVVKGEKITFSTTDTTGNLVVMDADKSVTLKAAGVYALDAQYEGMTKTFAVTTYDGNNTATILDYTFSASDAGLKATDSNGKQIWVGSGNTSWVWVNNKSGTTKEPRLRNDSGAGVVYLNPESEQGKIVSSFSDYTFYLRSVTHENWTNPASYSRNFPILTRYNMAGESYSLVNDTYVGYRAYFTTKGGGLVVGNKTLISSGLTYPYTNDYPHVDYKMQVEGADVIFSAKPANSTEYTQLFKLSENDTVVSKVNATIGKGGSIGLATDTENRPALQTAKVTISFTDLEIQNIVNCYIPDDAYIVYQNKPAIPMQVGKKIDLSNIYFQFKNGAYIGGKNITFNTTDASGSLIVLNDEKSMILRNSGLYELNVTFNGETETFYVVDYDTNNQKVIYEYTFKSSDAGKVGDDGYYAFGSSATEKPWKFYAAAGTSVSWNTTKGGSANGVSATVNEGLWISSTTGYLTLNPNSKEGAMISSFTDLSIVYRATLHPNFVTYNSKTVPILAKYNMGSTSPKFANDTFVGYNAPWSSSTKGGMLYTGNLTHVGNAVTNPNYTIVNNVVTEGDLDFKFDFANGDYSFSVKGADSDESGYTTLYTMSTDSTAPEAAKNAAKGKGTFAMYTDTNTRVSSQYFKVTITFTDDEIQNAANCYVENNSYIVTQAKPVIPVNADAISNLSNVMFEMSDGTIKPISSVIVEFENSKDIVYNADDYTLEIYNRDLYTATVKLDESDAGLKYYFVTPDNNGEYKIYDKTFSSADIENGNFVADSEWQLLPGSAQNPLSINSKTGGITADSLEAYYALKPESEAAKIISSFRDITMEAQIGFTTLFSQYGNEFIMAVRANWADNSSLTSTPSTYVGGGYRTCLDVNTASTHKDFAKTNISGKESSVEFDTSYTTNNDLRTYRISAIGDTFELYREGVASGAAMTDAQASAIKNTKAGNVWIRSTKNDRIIIKSVKVFGVFSEEEINGIASTDIDFDYIVDASGTSDVRTEKIFTTVGDAISYIGEKGGTIKVRGNVTTANLANTSKKDHKDIVITSYDGVAANAILTITNARTRIYGNITFENITVVPNTEVMTISDYTLTFGEGTVAKNVTTYSKGTSGYNNIVMNSEYVTFPSDYDAGIYVYEGAINLNKTMTLTKGSYSNYVMGGLVNYQGVINGNHTVRLNGATIKNIYTGLVGTLINNDLTIHGTNTFIMDSGNVTGTVYLDSMSSSSAGRKTYVHNLLYVFNESTMENDVRVQSGGKNTRLREDSKWILIRNNAENGRVTVYTEASNDLDYMLTVNGGTAEAVFTDVTSYDYASSEFLGFRFNSDSDKKDVFVNKKTIVKPDANGLYDLSLFEGSGVISIEFVNEEDIEAIYEEIADITSYRTEGNYTAPTKADHLFGGWFKLEDGVYVALTEEEANTATSAYAKFVPVGVLKIGWQLEKDVTTDTDAADLRFITTIDSFDYKKVNFVLTLNGRDSNPITTNVGYTTLIGYENNNKVKYKPNETFSPESIRFMAGMLYNVPNQVFTNESAYPLYVTASWVTMDGTEVKGSRQIIKFSRAVKPGVQYENAVICWGDSITMGLGMGANQNYPDLLDSLISGDVKVLNGGVGGENSASILSRANAIQTTLKNTITFEAGQKDVKLTETSFVGSNGEYIRYVHYVFGNRLSQRKVLIDGVEYEMYALPGEGSDCHYYMLHRKDASNTVTINAGATVEYDYSDIYKNNVCNIALIGCNDGENYSASALVERYKLIEAQSDKFIAISPFYYGTSQHEALKAEFGDRYVNFREYVRTEECFNKYGADLGYTSLDAWNAAWAGIADGNLIGALTQDGNVTNVHLSAKGYKILANLVYEKGVELGYWN